MDRMELADQFDEFATLIESNASKSELDAMSLKLTATLGKIAKTKDLRLFEAMKVATNVTTHISLLDGKSPTYTAVEKRRDELGPANPEKWSRDLRQVATDLRESD